jgi:hypothetical protein
VDLVVRARSFALRRDEVLGLGFGDLVVRAKSLAAQFVEGDPARLQLAQLLDGNGHCFSSSVVISAFGSASTGAGASLFGGSRFSPGSVATL